MKYRKKPVEIEAMQFTGSAREILQWAHKDLPPEMNSIIRLGYNCLVVRTLEGDMTAQINDFIIKGIKGEFYPCKQDIFNLTYEEIQ